MKAKARRRIGPRMRDVQSIVYHAPGCRAIVAARAVGPHNSLRYGYATVHRAIDAGIVRAEPVPGGYRLWPVREEG